MSVTKIKICGITRVEDARDAVELGVDLIGINFWPESPRFCTRDKAAVIIAAAGVRDRTVGVFVNAALDEIRATVGGLGLAGIQLHGNEPADFCRQVKETFPDRMLIKAVRVSAPGPLLDDAIGCCGADFLLLDSFRPGARGGTGVPLDMNFLCGSNISFGNVFLAGGIKSENAAAYVQAFHPYGLDAASGVEDRPGIKSRRKLEQFMEAVRSAECGAKN